MLFQINQQGSLILFDMFSVPHRDPANLSGLDCTRTANVAKVHSAGPPPPTFARPTGLSPEKVRGGDFRESDR